MPSISATTRVLVISALALVILSEDTSARPIPNSGPYLAKQARQAGLISTSSLVVPPLPPLVMARSGSNGSKVLKPSSFTTNSVRSLHSSVHDDHRVDRRDTSSHEHIFTHAHDGGYDHMYRYPDGWTADMIAHHHSKHWAEHHGLLKEYPSWSDNDHVHVHNHEHVHPRDGLGQDEDEALTVTERGLVGDLIRPLLAPLNVIPGFVSISKLLFGDGVSDGGLLKTLGGLVLHVEKEEEVASDGLYSFSLVASNTDHTQVYLAPVNGSAADNNAEKAFNETSTSSSNDTLSVKITLPLLSANGSAVLMCASYSVAPPSALNLETCHDNSTGPADGDSKLRTSQLFTYTPSTGELAPTYIAHDDSADDPVQVAVQLSASTAKTAFEENDTATSMTPHGNATNATLDDGSSSSASNTTKSQVIMHFTPVSTVTASNGTAVDSSTNASKTSTPIDKANSPVADPASSSVAPPSSTTVITITQVLAPSPMDARRLSTNAERTLQLSPADQPQGEEDSVAEDDRDSSIDNEAADSPSVVTKDDVVSSSLSTPATTDTAVFDEEDDATQIFLAEKTLDSHDTRSHAVAEMSKTNAAFSSSSLSTPAPSQTQSISSTQAADARPSDDANHCPCFAEKKRK